MPQISGWNGCPLIQEKETRHSESHGRKARTEGRHLDSGWGAEVVTETVGGGEAWRRGYGQLWLASALPWEQGIRGLGKEWKLEDRLPWSGSTGQSVRRVTNRN